MAKLKSNANVLNIKNIRVCDLSIVPLNQLEKMAKEGYQIPMIKKGMDSNCPHLTDREKECFRYFSDGLNVKKIAEIMALSERRIFNILEKLRDKFQVNTDHWLVAKYYQMGLDNSL